MKNCIKSYKNILLALILGIIAGLTSFINYDLKLLILAVLIVLLSIWFVNNYIKSFSPLSIFLYFWSLFLFISLMHLTYLEDEISIYTYFIVFISIVSFVFGFKVIQKKLKLDTKDEPKYLISEYRIFNFVLVLFILGVVSFVYIYIKTGIPIFSQTPDAKRFEISRQIFGPIEYLSWIHHVLIPIEFSLIMSRKIRGLRKIALFILMIVGLLILASSTTRLMLFIPMFMCLIIFVYYKRENKKLLYVSFAFLVSVFLLVFYGIFKIRYGAIGGLEYLANIFQPKKEWYVYIISVYSVFSFNMQTLDGILSTYPSFSFNGANTFFNVINSVLNIHLGQVEIIWGDIFLPFWVTGTYLGKIYIDLGVLGIILIPFIFGSLSGYIYKKFINSSYQNKFFYIIIFSYLNLVLVLNFYTVYMFREEVFLNIILFCFLFMLSRKRLFQ